MAIRELPTGGALSHLGKLVESLISNPGLSSAPTEDYSGVYFTLSITTQVIHFIVPYSVLGKAFLGYERRW